MSLQEALKILNIEDYAEKIFNSNSHGELFHLHQYVLIAESFNSNADWFRGWFESVVKWAEENWERPASVYQHIDKILAEQLSYNVPKI